MSHPRTIENFLFCLERHPSYPSGQGSLLLAYTQEYQAFASNVAKAIESKPHAPTVKLFTLDQCDPQTLKQEVERSSLYTFFYNSDYASPQLKPYYILEIDPYLKAHWQKSCVIKNYHGYFDEAYGTFPPKIKTINDELIALAATSKHMTFQDKRGSHITIDIEAAKWTSIDGHGNPDIIPGEIATLGKLNGKAYFSGAFLSTLPFAYNYGIISESPLYLEFKDNVIVDFKGISSDFEEQFSDFIQFKASNRRVEEVGIGTNPTVKNLYSVNAGFEERHVGLHLGLGGGEMGSNHVDLIFKDGTIHFDDTLIIRDTDIVYPA